MRTADLCGKYYRACEGLRPAGGGPWPANARRWSALWSWPSDLDRRFSAPVARTKPARNDSPETLAPLTSPTLFLSCDGGCWEAEPHAVGAPPATASSTTVAALPSLPFLPSLSLLAFSLRLASRAPDGDSRQESAPLWPSCRCVRAPEGACTVIKRLRDGAQRPWRSSLEGCCLFPMRVCSLSGASACRYTLGSRGTSTAGDGGALFRRARSPLQ
jgi:hypothetical protein